jgi:hypothetical protein
MPPPLTTLKERLSPIWKAALGIVVVIAALIGLVFWLGPSWVWDRYHSNREDLTPIVTLLGAAIAAWVALRQVQIALAQARTAADRHQAQTNADRQRHITESFSKATEQLGSDKIEARLGGIYTLERISRESPDDYWTVMETLCAFVRERARWSSEKCPSEAHREIGPPTDIAAVLAVIARRDEKRRENDEIKWLDLCETDLRSVSLIKANLSGVSLLGANLSGAHLLLANLGGANLIRANLSGGNLLRANLSNGILRGANLRGADLRATILVGADLSETNLGEANLTGADLRGANFREADVKGANLSGINLGWADLVDTVGDAKTRLLDDVPRPAHWPPYKP